MPRQRPFLSLHALALAAACGTACAAPQTFSLDPANTRVHWEVVHFGTSTSRGRFDSLDGSITLDSQAQRGEVSISVATASVSTGLALFDGVLRGPLLLAAKEHPSAYFVARQFTFDGERPTALSGEFTLRGIGQPLTLRALRFSCRSDAATQREVCGGDFEGEIRRSDFGITHSLPFVADRVRLLIQIEAFR